MKGEFIMKANMINTNSIKTYLCAVVMLLGMSANAWGASCDLKIWDKASSSYITWKTIDESYTFGSESYPYYDDGGVYHTVICWTPSTYSGGFPSSEYYYYNQQYGDRGTPSELYAVYLESGSSYTSAPDFQVGFCTYTLTAPSGLSVNTNYESGGNIYVKFSWTPGDATNAEYQKFCYGAVGDEGKCVDNLSKSATYTGDLRSKLSNGEYWWSIQALGDNDKYCNSSVVEGPHFCIDEITTSTPSGVAASSLTTSSATVSWSALSDAAGYVLTIKKKSDGSKVSGFDEKDVEGTSASVTGLLAGTTYKVALTAYNSCADISLTNNSYEFTTLVEYAITLDGNSGSDGLAGVYANATSLHEITEPTKTGYHVEGYYTTSACATKVATDAGALQASITVSATEWTNSSSQWTKGGNATFYANWAANTHTVTLDQNGGSGGSSSVTATYNSAMPSATMPNTPPAVGKVFEGYYYNSVKYYNADGSSAHVWDVDGDATLVASWTTATPTLSIASVDKIVISSTTPSLAEGASTSVAYNSTVTLSHGEPDAGYYWYDWNVYETGNESNIVTVTNNQFAMPDFDVTVSANLYTDLVFSCAELTLTPHLVTDGTLIFITSTASKKVRSQDYITITGSGLTPSTALTFPGLDSKFEVLTGTGGTISTDASGAIDVNAYIFYTPAAESTGDGLDKMAGISVSVGGAKPKQVTLIQEIIGRHLPADFVIAAKNTTTNKWYALPANMSGTGNPEPVEIAVDDINNPTIAYTAASNVYNLYLSADKEKVQLGMKNNVDGSSKSYALWANNAASSTDIGKNTGLAENTLGDNYKWTLTQTNTSITNPQDAKYTISNLNNVNPLKSWFAAGGGPKWGLYASGVAELRLIPASSVVPTEAYFVEWAQHGGVIEVDAEGVDATSVVAHLGEAKSSAITLVQTKAGDAKNAKSKYNYTVNFGVGIDFADAASNGAMLTLEWKNGETVKAVSNIVVPKIVASNITINKANYPLKSDWNTEVHVLPGKTVTVDPSAYDGSNVTIKELNIYPGATVVASTGTLIATNLVLRNGWSRAGEKTYDVARLYVTPSTATLKASNVYADWYIDYDQYYPVAVPWNATVANFTYRYCSVLPTVGHDKNIRLRYYDGASRATNVQEGVGSGANWKLYGADGCASVPTTLTPSTGYAMTAKRPTGKAFSIIRMPLTLPSGTWGDGTWTTNGEAGNISTTHKDQVSVTAHGTGSTPSYAQGWNLIANPYMSLHQGAITYTGSGTAVTYVNIPDVDFKEYDQQPAVTAKLKPASAFLIQAPETGTITFGTANRKASTPSFRVEENPESVPEQQAYIVLNNEQSEDMMGILVSDKYTAEYELNADLEKLLGDGTSLKTYMHYGDMNMAYVAINEVLAREWIPVTVRIPESGEYTYSLHEASIAGELEGIYLIDYQNGDHVTNLIDESYSFTAEAGTINGRFAINAIVGQRETPTDIDIINAGGDIHSKKPVKFIWNDKVFILHRGVIYDSTGKRVREINR